MLLAPARHTAPHCSADAGRLRPAVGGGALISAVMSVECRPRCPGLSSSSIPAITTRRSCISRSPWWCPPPFPSAPRLTPPAPATHRDAHMRTHARTHARECARTHGGVQLLIARRPPFGSCGLSLYVQPLCYTAQPCSGTRVSRRVRLARAIIRRTLPRSSHQRQWRHSVGGGCCAPKAR